MMVLIIRLLVDVQSESRLCVQRDVGPVTVEKLTNFNLHCVSEVQYYMKSKMKPVFQTLIGSIVLSHNIH